MLCANCSSRKTCTKLCEKAERYVARGYVSKREITISESKIYSIEGVADIDLFDSLASIYTKEIARFEFLSPIENKIISMFHLQRKTYKEIAIRTNHKVRTVKHYLSRARVKIVAFYSNSVES